MQSIGLSGARPERTPRFCRCTVRWDTHLESEETEMKDKELQFDRTCHVLYSRPYRKEILARIALHYPQAEREAVWERVRTTTCANGCKCDYTICGDKDPYLNEHPEYRDEAEGPESRLARTTMMVLAVTLHNIPEGMAVGVMYAGLLAKNTQITAASALALSIGIAIQNFPESAIISMPLRAEGQRKGRAFLGGVLSGVVEPIGAALTILAAQLLTPALPYLLSFAAGAMLYVVVEELIPEMSQGRHSNLGTVCFAAGFSVMMVLDVALG